MPSMVVRGDAALQHQFGGGGHDTVAGCAAFRGQGVVIDWSHLHPFETE